MRLVDVYKTGMAPNVLYDLLRERTGDDSINISHASLPTWDEHVAFVQSKPYAAWYLIEVHNLADNFMVGTVYLTHEEEVGIFLFKRFQGKGYGPQAIRALIKRHPCKRYLANINPANERSIKMFERLGFRLLQQTYELRGDDSRR